MSALSPSRPSPPPPAELDGDGILRGKTPQDVYYFNPAAKGVDLGGLHDSSILLVPLWAGVSVYSGLPDNGIRLEGGDKFDFLKVEGFRNPAANMEFTDDGLMLGTVEVTGFEVVQEGFGNRAITYLPKMGQTALDALNLHKVLAGRDSDFFSTAWKIVQADGDIGAVYAEAFQGLNDQQIAVKLYGALGRDAGADEVQFWVHQLELAADDKTVVDRFFAAAAANGEAHSIGDTLVIWPEPEGLPQPPMLEPVGLTPVPPSVYFLP